MYLQFMMLLQKSQNYNSNQTEVNWSNSFASIGQFFYLLLIFSFVIILAYYSTRFIASSRFSSRYLKKGSANINIIETAFVGQQSSIQLVKVGEKYFIIGVTKEQINYLTEVSKEDVVIAEEQEQINRIPFEKYLNQFLPKKKDQ